MIKRQTRTALCLLPLLTTLTACALFEDEDGVVSDSGLYGAISYSNQTGRWSMATERPDPETARRDAVKACAEQDCVQVLAFGPGHCGAIAPGEIGRPGLSIARKPDRAEQAAVEFCIDQGGGACEEVVVACNP